LVDAKSFITSLVVSFRQHQYRLGHKRGPSPTGEGRGSRWLRNRRRSSEGDHEFFGEFVHQFFRDFFQFLAFGFFVVESHSAPKNNDFSKNPSKIK